MAAMTLAQRGQKLGMPRVVEPGVVKGFLLDGRGHQRRGAALERITRCPLDGFDRAGGVGRVGRAGLVLMAVVETQHRQGRRKHIDGIFRPVDGGDGYIDPQAGGAAFEHVDVGHREKGRQLEQRPVTMACQDEVGPDAGRLSHRDRQGQPRHGWRRHRRTIVA